MYIYKYTHTYIGMGFPGGSDSKVSPAMQETWVLSLGLEDPLEKEMATYSSTVAWKLPWTEEPDRLQSMGLQRVIHDWATSHIYMCVCVCVCVYFCLFSNLKLWNSEIHIEVKIKQINKTLWFPECESVIPSYVNYWNLRNYVFNTLRFFNEPERKQRNGNGICFTYFI